MAEPRPAPHADSEPGPNADGDSPAASGAGGFLVAGDKPLAEWQPLVLAELRRRHEANEETAQKLDAEGTRLFKLWEINGAVKWRDIDADMNTRWYWLPRGGRGGVLKPVRPSTARNRQWASLELFNVAADLGAPINPVALIGERIDRPTDYTSARPCTDDEDRRIRRRAESELARSRIGVIVAVAYSGGTPKETSAVRTCDVDLESATITFRGPAARVNPLDEWSVTMIRRFLANQGATPLHGSDLLCVSETTAAARRAHSIAVRLGRVLRDAGLKGRPGVTARSIRLTTARRVLESDGIEAAARFLGSPSLDTTAHALQYHWYGGDD